MNSTPGIKKYYLGFFVLLAIGIGALGYALSQAGAAKVDKKTNDAVQKISQKMELYTISNGVPESLQQAGITDVPSTVKYTKISDSKYKICLDYKAASSGFDAGWFSLLGGGFNSPYTTDSGDKSYFDSTVQYNHKKGENCQTVNAGSYYYGGNTQNYNSGGTTDTSTNTNQQSYDNVACSSDYDSYYQVQGEATVASVDSTSKTINFQSNGQTVKDDQGKALPAISSLKYDSITVFCSAAKQTTTASSVKTGQKVKFFASSSSSVLDKVQL